MNYYKWIDSNGFSLKGKTVALSGATGGIGSILCDYIAYLGANILCLDRNAEKSNALIEKLKIKYPNLSAKHITLDLEKFDNVKNVCKQLKEIDIDYLVLNAGAYKIPRYKCDTGYNNVFQINFISPYFLARELSSQIIKKGGRVVAVSSIAHNYSKIDIKDIDFSDKKASSKVYGNAKRFLTLSLFSYFNSKNVLSIVHPGITLTNITAHFPKLVFALIKYPMKVIFMSAKKASLCILYGLFDRTQTGEWIGPRLLNIWGLPRKKQLKTFTYCELICSKEISNKIYDKLTKD
ncbi:MAG: SDR family NAD(P)-dependent oxidoreductase [Clostridia bacterium]|nr:SDR family NAD(P)-dependent oxidoreductase [Clostridia bacterium]